MPRLSKLDRMIEITEAMSEADGIADLVSTLEELSTAAQEAQEAIEQITEAADTAYGAHEEREWEQRNDSLAEIPDQLEQLSSALDGLDDFNEALLVTLREAITNARKAHDAAQKHIDHLIEI